jgi:hypothetical protein
MASCYTNRFVFYINQQHFVSLHKIYSRKENSSNIKIWKQSDPSEALIKTKLHENCTIGLIESVHEG